jgi:hypothetical protein
VNFLHLDGPAPLPETEINKFLDLETIGITAHQGKSWDSKDSAVLQTFHGSFRIEDNLMVVSLPKKEKVLFEATNRMRRTGSSPWKQS